MAVVTYSIPDVADMHVGRHNLSVHADHAVDFGHEVVDALAVAVLHCVADVIEQGDEGLEVVAHIVVQLRDTCMVDVAMADGKPSRGCMYFASSTEEFTCEY